VQEIQRVSMSHFVTTLRAIPEEEFQQGPILKLMSKLLLTQESLDRYVHRSQERYTRNLVYRNELFEVMVVCWDVGQKTPIHNHDNQLGWLSIQRGMLSLQNHRRISCIHGGPGKDPKHCRAGFPSPVELEEVSNIAISGTGAVTTTDRDDTIHEIANLKAFEGPAVSVHVYSRPLDSCVVFDPVTRTCRRVQLSFHSEYGKVVAAA
jgi:cysteine dioxygenase